MIMLLDSRISLRISKHTSEQKSTGRKVRSDLYDTDTRLLHTYASLLLFSLHLWRACLSS